MSEKQVKTEAEVIEANIVRPSRGGARFILLVAAVLALAGAAALWQGLRAQRQVAARVDATVSQAVDALGARIDDLDKRIESNAQAGAAAEGLKQALSTRLDSLNEKQAALQQQVNAAVASLANGPAGRDDAWRLDEAQHLLGIAEQRLRLERDVATAIAAAELVDRRLAEGNDPSLLPIREQLIAELAALRAVPVADVAGISLTLSSLIDQVDSLPLKAGDVGDDIAPATSPAPSSSPSGWRGALGRVWQDLRGLVEVKSAAVPDDVIFDPEKRYLLHQGLRLELAAARLDALRGATDSFRAAIARIGVQLERYFDTQSAPVTAAVAALAALRDVDLSPPLPGFEKSIKLLSAQRAAALEAAKAAPAPAPAPQAPLDTPADEQAGAPPSPIDETTPAGGAELHVEPAPPDMGLTPPVDSATGTAPVPESAPAPADSTSP